MNANFKKKFYWPLLLDPSFLPVDAFFQFNMYNLIVDFDAMQWIDK